MQQILKKSLIPWNPAMTQVVKPIKEKVHNLPPLKIATDEGFYVFEIDVSNSE